MGSAFKDAVKAERERVTMERKADSEMAKARLGAKVGAFQASVSEPFSDKAARALAYGGKGRFRKNVFKAGMAVKSGLMKAGKNFKQKTAEFDRQNTMIRDPKKGTSMGGLLGDELRRR